jgi:hypothetical protein
MILLPIDLWRCVPIGAPRLLVNADYSLALPIAKARASQVSKAALENFDLKASEQRQ